MTENPFEPSEESQAVAKQVKRKTSLDDEDELDVLYCDGRSFQSFFRVKLFSDRGTISFASKESADFFGKRQRLRGLQLESMTLARPAFPNIVFLVTEVLLVAYFMLFVIPSRDVYRIWSMGILFSILTLLLIRLHTLAWLEMTVQDGDEKTKHCFFYMGRAFAWSTMWRGNRPMLDYFQR